MTAKHSGGASAGSAYPVRVITDARPGASEDLARRQRRYIIVMSFRTACFILMIFVPGWFRWVLLGAAVLLPYAAVLMANQANQKGSTAARQEPVESEPLPALTTGGEQVISGEADEPDPAAGEQRSRERPGFHGRVA